MKRMLILTASTALAIAASSSPALAASGQVLCITGQQINAPNSSGQCKSGWTQVTVATESEVSALQDQVSTLQGQVSALQGANTTLSGDVSALQQTLSKVSYNPQGVNGQPTLTITGANLQVVNGTGQTDSANGLGNVIVGYDANPGVQTGSHNIVLGYDQAFTSYGGIIGGWNNKLYGNDSLVFGVGDTASGIASAVTGGFASTASGFGASISGGTGNTASNYESSVSGGADNVASGFRAAVSGGEYNTASGDYSAILGGNGVSVATTDGTAP